MPNRDELIGAQLECVRVPPSCHNTVVCWDLGYCALSRDETRRVVLKKPEPTRVARIKDPGAVKAKMRGERACRCGCGAKATDGHHILPRSLGGDDVRDNICGLAHACHMIFEFGSTERQEIGALIGARLKDDEIRYVLRKLAPRRFAAADDRSADDPAWADPGWEWLAKYYSVERRHIETEAA